MRLKDKVVIVTGASRGIGKSIAVEMAKEGAKIVVNYNNNKEKAMEVIKEIEDIQGTAVAVKADISKRNEVREMINIVVKNFGDIHILVNNAGMLQQKPFETITDEEWDKMFEVNMKGSFICSQECIPYMVKNNFGRIINIASIGGQWGGNLAVHYSATKAGIISLTRSLAKIYSKDGINTNCISPGLVLTEMSAAEMATEAGKEKLKNIPINRPATPEEIGRISVFLASEDGSYMTGQTINANGGMLFNV
ncbi:glucose 1-dehydrogenase [Clostridium botulinum]|uniref:SDR family NAD(P)-dependent oxidoreductase n=1 Tax=Clostridium botulinum TaxID=1491 RepID=UPI0013C56DB7|nr:3-oxoacyl-ACP reductase FabG [Clostridium botulinum]MBY6836409.1 3-oxoacyl-ACP reductase FabG [Clostridium botulinum]NFG64253.1 glucose 1-dehydrogenase [Clostridium botulinum]NFN18144.1 glucose 1-dehydrogenase [Clostridium botulinum]NFN47803.1 glucose 1-dehydrogenase [Clostridium botulinum]NFQ23025.1 glucose 1-dehydrogenase [Clostridium botulinum]